MIYSAKAFVCQVVAHQLFQEGFALIDVLDEETLVEGEVNLEETDHRLHDGREFVSKLWEEKVIEIII